MRTSAVEGTLRRLYTALEAADLREETAGRADLLQSLDPRVKLCGVLVWIVAIAAARNHRALLGSFVAVLIVVALSHVPLSRILVVASGGLLLATILALPALVLVPGQPVFFSVTDQGLRSAGYLILRSASVVILSALLILTTPWNQLLRALRALGVPVVMVVLLGMTYRYIFLFLRNSLEMFEARKSRLLGTLSVPERRRLIVASIGVLLSKTYTMGQAVFQAMQARGYRGEVYLFHDFVWRPRDWGAAVACGTVAVATWIAGR